MFSLRALRAVCPYLTATKDEHKLTTGISHRNHIDINVIRAIRKECSANRPASIKARSAEVEAEVDPLGVIWSDDVNPEDERFMKLTYLKIKNKLY